jgi:transcriptional regulator with PAS, ATPase and Fis domain
MRPRRLDLDDVTDVVPDALGGEPRALLRRQPVVRWQDSTGSHSIQVEARVVVGSGGGVDLMIADPSVSRLHAELDVRDDGLWITDLGSRNGTFVEGVRVAAACIPDRGRARLGATDLTIEYAVAPSHVELWPDPFFGPLVGQSAAMRAVFARLARIAPTDSTVLVRGETGTGKELVAEAIHEASTRASAPFVVVDCAALPEDLLESELFGHVRGSFTGAVGTRTGAVEAADGGTVFLDEVGELPLAMQPKLLRVIESRAVRRLGETSYRKINVRFVSATHRDLRTMVNAGTFREDLYFRLAVLPVEIPPLRARPEDLPVLVQHFLPPERAGAVSPELLRELGTRPWHGNVRELRNFVERALALGPQEALASVSRAKAVALTESAPELPSPPLDQPLKDLRERWLNHLEREYIRGLLARHGGNIVAVANAAGVDRTHVYRLLRKHDLDVVRPGDNR